MSTVSESFIIIPLSVLEEFARTKCWICRWWSYQRSDIDGCEVHIKDISDGEMVYYQLV